MALERNSKRIKNQSSLEFIVILSVVIIITIMVVVYLTYFIHNVSIGSPDEIISAQASSSNILLLKLTNPLPKGVQIIGINFTGVPSGASVSVSLKNQTPVYNNGYPEYTFSVNGLTNSLTYYNVSDLVYNENGKTIAVSTLSGEPSKIEQSVGYSGNGNNGNNGNNNNPQSGSIYYVPITITNSQSSTTSSPFQQMINIQEGSFSNYLTYNGNFADFEYVYANNVVIPSWIQENNSGTITTWLNIKNGIPADSSITIYLKIDTGNNLLSNSGTSGIGEAPQLSPTYAQYDDGMSVFPIYYNFAGTTLDSRISTINGALLTQNNGLSFATSETFTSFYILTSSYATSPFIMEADETYYGVPYAENGDERWGLVIDSGSSTSTSISNSGVGGTNFMACFLNSGSLSPQIWQGGAEWIWKNLNYNYQYTAIDNFTQTSSGINVNFDGTSLSAPATIYTSGYIGFYMSSDTPNSNIATVHWLRIRAYPPSGVMPTVSFGPVQPA